MRLLDIAIRMQAKHGLIKWWIDSYIPLVESCRYFAAI